MTRPAVATVLSARAWEPRLCDAAARSGLVRIVGRLFEPIDLTRTPGVDWLVVGSETAWLTATAIDGIRAAGTAVVGIHPDGDLPAARSLAEAGADLVVPESTEPVGLLARLLLPPDRPGRDRRGRVVAVVGPRGAGVTTVAIGLACATPGSALVDTDEVPGAGPALGLAPPVAGSLVLGPLRTGATPAGPDGPTVVSVGATEGPVTLEVVTDLVRRAALGFPLVVVDAPPPFDARVGWCADEVVLVLDAGVQGLLRGMGLVDAWPWPVPRLVLNRVHDRDDATGAARAAVGLEPAGWVPWSTDPVGAAVMALGPAVGAPAA